MKKEATAKKKPVVSAVASGVSDQSYRAKGVAFGRRSGAEDRGDPSRLQPLDASAPLAADARRLEYVPLSTIKGAKSNPKLHATSELGKSIGRFGFTEPPVLDERTGRLVVGHGRIESLRARKAAKEAPPEGIKATGDEWLVPVLRGWASRSDTEAEAMLLASNQLVTAGGWSEAELAQMLKSLEAQQALEGVGFGDEELARLLAEATQSALGNDQAEPDEALPEGIDDVPEAPAPADTYVKRGDVYQLGRHTLTCGDSREVVAKLGPASIAAVVTDPPYELGFMGKSWDASGIAYSVPLWQSVLKALKPGGHVLSFGGTRTYHRMAVALEHAGAEIRDCIMWLYGQGFPKSLNVSADAAFCQCDSVRCGHERNSDLRRMRESLPNVGGMASEGEGQDVLASMQRGAARRGMGEVGVEGQGGLERWSADLPGTNEGPGQPRLEGRRDVPARKGQLRGPPVREMSSRVSRDGSEGRLRHGASAGDGDVDGALPGEDRGGAPRGPQSAQQRADEPGVVPEQWGAQTCRSCGRPRVESGLGTALKPAVEPCVLARKPLEGTVAQNVQAHGTGGLNIDASRVGTEGGTSSTAREGSGMFGVGAGFAMEALDAGRWPANLVLDPEAAQQLDEQSGVSTSPSGLITQGGDHFSIGSTARTRGTKFQGHGDTGGASRFFYVAKASRSERDAMEGPAISRAQATGRKEGSRQGSRNFHPTVKPVALMRHLAGLVTPPGGTVLEPFSGSGTTLLACETLGFTCHAIEQEPAYVQIAIARWEKLTGQKAKQVSGATP